jgi:hypothetical protein
MIKEFDFHKAQSGKPISLRNGWEARILGTVKADKYPLIVAYQRKPDAQEDIGRYTMNGNHEFGCQTEMDLVMVTKEYTVWINLYKTTDGEIKTDGRCYNTPDIAHENNWVLRNTKAKYLGYFPITFNIE